MMKTLFSFLFKIDISKKAKKINFMCIPILYIKYNKVNTIYLLFLFIPIYIKYNHIKCYYFEGERNFGDLLNKDIFLFFNKDIICTDIYHSNIIALGSLLQELFRKRKLSLKRKILLYLSKPIFVWGSGFIENIPSNYHAKVRLDVRAVRGYKSLDKLRQLKIVKKTDYVVVGDPGLLVRYFVDISKVKKKYSLGIVPHYVDKGNPLLNKINVKNSVIIDIQQDPKAFVKQIAECNFIISSAMHALIASDSLGIPNVRMVLSNEIVGGDYKYDDYYSVFGLERHNKIDLNKSK